MKDDNDNLDQLDEQLPDDNMAGDTAQDDDQPAGHSSYQAHNCRSVLLRFSKDATTVLVKCSQGFEDFQGGVTCVPSACRQHLNHGFCWLPC